MIQGSRFILRSTMALLGIIVSYSLWVIYWPPSWKPVQNQWEVNVATVEDFVFQHSNEKVIYIGSSMMKRIQPEFVPKAHFVFACLGSTPVTLLDIMNRANAHPDTLFVEANSSLGVYNPELPNRVFDPTMGKVRALFPFMRDGNKPFSKLFGPIANETARAILGKNDQNGPQGPLARDNNAFKELEARLNEMNAKPIPAATLKSNWMALLAALHPFQQSGTKVVFINLPVSANSIKLRSSIQIDSVLSADALQYHYSYVPMPNVNQYQTSDGIHMELSSAKRYAKWLLTQKF